MKAGLWRVKTIKQVVDGQDMQAQMRQMAKRDTPVADPDGCCQLAKISPQRQHTMRYKIDCMMDGRRTTGKGESTFFGNSVTSRMDMTTMDASGRHSMQAESQMTYLGPDCKGLTQVGAGRKR